MTVSMEGRFEITFRIIIIPSCLVDNFSFLNFVLLNLKATEITYDFDSVFIAIQAS